MAIYKSKTYIETYKFKAKSSDINELTGRTGRPELTEFIINNIAAKLNLKEDDVCVDIGCGDGLLLQKIGVLGVNGLKGRLIGILPNIEEVIKVQEHLTNNPGTGKPFITISQGKAEQSGLPDCFADLVVCNGVLHGAGQTIEIVNQSIKEFGRICKPGAILFIGEMPDSNELSGKNYGDSIFSWLKWVLKNQGLRPMLTRTREVIKGFLGKEPFVIMPKTMFYMNPVEFEALLENFGFRIVSKEKLKELSLDGKEVESKTRWNYITKKVT